MKESGEDRLPAVAFALAAVACVALELASGGLPGLWLAAILMVGSVGLPWRIRSDFAAALAAIALSSILIAITPDPPDNAALQIGPAKARNVFGQAMVAGMVACAWFSGQKRHATRLLFFSLFAAMAMLAACNTYDTQRVRWCIAPFVLLLLANLRQVRRRPRPNARLRVLLGVSFASVLAMGWTTQWLGESNKSQIMAWGNPLPQLTPWEGARSGLGQPVIGPRFGDPGSPTRVLRLRGGDGGHLRGTAYWVYDNGRWSPSIESRTLRAFDVVPTPPTGSGANHKTVSVDRLDPETTVLHTTLDTWGLDLGTDPGVEWSVPDGPLLASRRTPPDYQLFVGAQRGKGRWDGPPSADRRNAMSAIPPALASTLRNTAQSAIQGAKNDRERAMRVVGWLSSRHGYSTTFLPGEGDPIRWFLEHPGSDAHCEVFASATALLLRSVGIPARYVVGYLAHERDRQGNWIVRARDAHAWVEAWCDGEQWVTIEATPAAGTPAGRDTSVPWWRRFVEEISDTAIGLRDTVVNSDPALVSIGVGVVALAAMTSAILIRRRSTTNGRADFGNPVDPRLRHRIEGMLARHGSPVAENLTWLAAVSALPDADPVKEPLSAYLRLLCADRFGGGTDGSVLATAWDSVLNADQTWKHQSG